VWFSKEVERKKGGGSVGRPEKWAYEGIRKNMIETPRSPSNKTWFAQKKRKKSEKEG